MPIVVFQYDSTWSTVWYSLGPLTQLFLLSLTLVVAYTIYFAAVILVRLRGLRTAQNDHPSRRSLAQLNHRLANLRQIILAIFFFFGLTFSLGIQRAFWTPESKDRSVGLMVLENFRVSFRFAVIVFLVFLTVHSVQWFLATRIRATELRLDVPVAGNLSDRPAANSR
jgi:hypothetical protein